MFNKRYRNNREGFAIMLLLGQMANLGFDKIPPVTLFTIIGQILIYLRLLVLEDRIGVDEVCISAVEVWYNEDWLRLIFGAIQHGSEWHLYYNMISMLWKGRQIELNLGSARFAALLAIFTPLVSIVLLALIGLTVLITDDPTSLAGCHVGFSGVLFALKVVLNYQEPNVTHYVFGMIPVSSTMVYWVELLLIHVLVPNSSFLGHLAGILVGLLYVHGPFMESIVHSLPRSTPGSFNQRHSRNDQQYGQSSFWNSPPYH